MATSFSRIAQECRYLPSLQSALGRLESLIDWERRTRARGSQRLMRVNNKPSETLLKALGDPHKKFRAVHITGSKGKGSVSALVGAGLLAAGSRVGVYGSPHVERVTERVQICGSEIEDDALADALSKVLDIREKLGLSDATWFDVMSTSGLLALASANVEWAVVEVGLGGRLDSTNVLRAPVTVVTNISLEHEEIIGPTLRDIATEKSGIIWPHSQAVVGMEKSNDLASIFIDRANAVQAKRPIFVPPPSDQSISSYNIALARHALQFALPEHNPHHLLPKEVAQEVLARLPGRMERFMVSANVLRGDRGALDRDEVEVIVDGAHVAESVRHVLSDICKTSSPALVVLLALGMDKRSDSICKEIASACPERVIVTAVGDDERYLQGGKLHEIAVASGIPVVIEAVNPSEGLQMAVKAASEIGARVVVIGSLHLAGAVRPALRSSRVRDV